MCLNLDPVSIPFSPFECYGVVGNHAVCRGGGTSPLLPPTSLVFSALVFGNGHVPMTLAAGLRGSIHRGNGEMLKDEGATKDRKNDTKQ